MIGTGPGMESLLVHTFPTMIDDHDIGMGKPGIVRRYWDPIRRDDSLFSDKVDGSTVTAHCRSREIRVVRGDCSEGYHQL